MNLRVRSDNTFLKSTLTINKLIKLSKHYGYDSVALCDVNNMHGASEFYFECLKNNLKPIIGLELSVYFEEKMSSNILLFAQDELGYKNLVMLTSLVNRYQVQALEKKVLKLYAQGLSCVIPSDQAYFLQLVNNNQIFEANEWLEQVKNIYPNTYFGIYRYPECNHEQLQFLKDLCLNQQIRPIAMQMAIHKNKDDTIALNMLDCIKKQVKANKDFLKNPAIVHSYFKSLNEINAIYEKDELQNLRRMISSLNVKITKLPFALPKSYSGNQSPMEIVKDICYKRLKELNLENDTYRLRLEMELNVIGKMGFGNYFLIVADYVNYAKMHDIMVGPARGSAGGSIVAYLLNITTIDPIHHGLIFERFLNVARLSLPDIDVDFLDVKRDQVIEYLKEKYGYQYVSHIGTFSTLGPKSSIRDIGRILQMNNEEVDYLLSFYPKPKKDEKELTILQAYKQDQSFKEIVDRHQKYKHLISLASQIEGLKRQSGIHAAGMVLFDKPINETVPTSEVAPHTFVTQFEYVQVEKIGLVKMDLLGIKNLTIIDVCLKEINKQYQHNFTIDNFVYDLPEVYQYLSLGDTIGIFQLESEGMKRVIKDLKPTCFEDVVSLLALYRPGPMNNIPLYIARKHKKEKVVYLHEDLKEILEPTYGIIIYQEQIMQIVQKIANYTMSEADLFRKAIGKKDKNIINEQKGIFIPRAIKNHYDEKFARELFDLIERFAEYGYNKAHSVGYAKITMIMASIKYQYPEIFYATMLNMNADSDSKKIALSNEAKYFNLNISFPNVNESNYAFTAQHKQLMFGIANIRTLKNKVALDILEERKNGLFVDIYDFMIRMIKINLSMANFEALIYSGALDCFHIKRSILMANLLTLYDYGKMFYDLPYRIGDYHSYDYIPVPILLDKPLEIDFVVKEKEYLGMFLSKHPIKEIKEKYKDNVCDIYNIENKEYDINLLGKITRIELRKNKSGKDMLLVILEDDTGKTNLYGYSKMALEYIGQFKKQDMVLVTVHVKNKEILYVNKMVLLGGK